MRQSIATKYHGAGNVIGSRVSVTASGGIRKYYSWLHEFNIEKNHLMAAQEFAKHMGWDGKWIGGGTKDGYVFVNDTGDSDDTFTVQPSYK